MRPPPQVGDTREPRAGPRKNLGRELLHRQPADCGRQGAQSWMLRGVDGLSLSLPRNGEPRGQRSFFRGQGVTSDLPLEETTAACFRTCHRPAPGAARRASVTWRRRQRAWQRPAGCRRRGRASVAHLPAAARQPPAVARSPRSSESESTCATFWKPVRWVRMGAELAIPLQFGLALGANRRTLVAGARNGCARRHRDFGEIGDMVNPPVASASPCNLDLARAVVEDGHAPSARTLPGPSCLAAVAGSCRLAAARASISRSRHSRDRWPNGPVPFRCWDRRGLATRHSAAACGGSRLKIRLHRARSRAFRGRAIRMHRSSSGGRRAARREWQGRSRLPGCIADCCTPRRPGRCGRIDGPGSAVAARHLAIERAPWPRRRPLQPLPSAPADHRGRARRRAC